MQVITIAKDFSRTPGGRFRTDGPYSGEEFREKYLLPAIHADGAEIILDGAAGYPSSFLEEAFGGLRRRGVPFEAIQNKIHISARDPEYGRYVERIWKYIREAKSGGSS
jgi:hypothetical protein